MAFKPSINVPPLKLKKLLLGDICTSIKEKYQLFLDSTGKPHVFQFLKMRKQKQIIK